MNDQDKKLLMETMGFKPGRWFFRKVWNAPLGAPGDRAMYELEGYDSFRPESRVEDDYFVLKWMREQGGIYLPDGEYTVEQEDLWNQFTDALTPFPPTHGTYEIGDYARAALKVIESKEDSGA